jgi:hypothetical protein
MIIPAVHVKFEGETDVVPLNRLRYALSSDISAWLA